MLDGKTPRTLGLKDIISKYVDYQKEVIIRRTRFDLAKDEKRVHILEGYKIAQDNIDEVVKIIKTAKSDVEAKEKLMSRFGLTEIQTDSILELKLRRLTGLEREKIELELSDLLKELKSILASEQKVLDIIKKELIEIKNKFGDERRTHIDMTAIDYIEDESLIPEEEVMITLTNKGYIKRLSVDTYKTQNKGGVGVKGMSTNEEDFVERMLVLTTHDYLMFFTNKGKVYRMKGYEIPEFSRHAKGLPIINLLPLDKDEKVSSMFTIKRDDDSKYLIFATKAGLVKRCNISEFENIRSSGKIAISLKDDDELISVSKSDGNKYIALVSSNGRMVKFIENEVRIMGRSASGVKGIELEDAYCIDAGIATDDKEVLVVTDNGYGKRTVMNEYRTTHRGSKGVKALNSTDKTGNIVAFKLVTSDEDLIIITNSGMVIRIPISQISLMSRVTQGVRLISLKDNQKVTSVFNIPHIENDADKAE